MIYARIDRAKQRQSSPKLQCLRINISKHTIYEYSFLRVSIWSSIFGRSYLESGVKSQPHAAGPTRLNGRINNDPCG
jgi:hypothetical protein